MTYFDEGYELTTGHAQSYVNSQAALSNTYGTVERTDSPNPDGACTVRCPLWGPAGNWVKCNMYAGGSNMSEKGNTGLWMPFQPGQQVRITFDMANTNQPSAEPSRAQSFGTEAV
jgi:hypothetical protein